MPFDVIQTTPLTGYAPNTAIGLDSTTPQLYIAGSDLMWRAVGGNELPIPVPIADGGTDATTAAGARTNLVAAESGVNSDITGLTAVAATTGRAGIAVTGAASGPGAIAVMGPNGQPALSVTDGIHSGSFTNDATLNCNGVECSGEIIGGSLLISGNCTIGELQNGTPGEPIVVNQNGSPGGDSCLVIAGPGAGPVSGKSLLAFDVNYATQLTVGGSGSAAAPPTNPVVYVQIKAFLPNGTPVIVCVPGYATA